MSIHIIMMLYFILLVVVIVMVIVGVAALPKKLILPAALVLLSSSLLGLGLSHVVFLDKYEVIAISCIPVLGFLSMLSTGSRQAARKQRSVMEIRYVHQEVSSARKMSKIA